jgi:hypothetical protein
MTPKKQKKQNYTNIKTQISYDVKPIFRSRSFFIVQNFKKAPKHSISAGKTIFACQK